MTCRELFYLGPEGTFTHQAAMEAADRLRPSVGGGADAGDAAVADGFDLVALPDVPSIMDAVQSGRGWGVIAWENNVEGYVVPNLDALIDATDIAGFARVRVDVTFDAFAVAGDDPLHRSGDDPIVVSAHPHGLAQCRRFIADHGLRAVPASSNAAACRDLKPGRIAFGPHICGELYGLDTLAERVQDFDGAHTEFLVLARRDEVRDLSRRFREDAIGEFETIITLIPLITGPGVLANMLDVMRDAGLNMTSFMSRPIKGTDGTYSFIATLDAAPWEPRFRTLLETFATHGIWLKTLAVYPRRDRPSPPVEAWRLPEGGVHLDAMRIEPDWEHTDKAGRELLW
ncbi:prephenate dehydratase [Bifidobacterium saguinibicoloris]|uniref:prephenate dehydratase n=1 Tax=Bifidobacterium saguinibicoloris TaxID=2834433 RepID=UPI001C56914F|nr:prephenate dehydratase domain-containing protein [Bifidobacterium saguinibicoloris]MBW3079826.1 chorismate mutase [Bifidobacterium saguinibicoloris]